MTWLLFARYNINISAHEHGLESVLLPTMGRSPVAWVSIRSGSVQREDPIELLFSRCLAALCVSFLTVARYSYRF